MCTKSQESTAGSSSTVCSHIFIKLTADPPDLSRMKPSHLPNFTLLRVSSVWCYDISVLTSCSLVIQIEALSQTAFRYEPELSACSRNLSGLGLFSSVSLGMTLPRKR